MKKALSSSRPPTLKTRVELFWKWYAKAAPRFYEIIDAKKAPSLAKEVSAKVEELFPGFAWVFGPGENGRGHSFTLSGEGDIHRQMVAIYWLSRAPSLPGWTFYASRQPGPVEDIVITIGQQKFDPVEFWITPNVDSESERVDIIAWHPLFDVLEARQRWTILYLFLDELFGEYGTQQFIGRIELGNQRLADAIPLIELFSFVNKVKAEGDWKSCPPGESYTVYSCEEPHDRFLRGDTVAGSTANFVLVRDYLEAKGELEDPLKNSGADFIFASFDASILPEENKTDARGDIEDALDKALKSSLSGRVLGGAHGVRHAYIDLMIFDGDESLAIVRRVLLERKLPSGTEIHFFAKEKRGHRIVL